MTIDWSHPATVAVVACAALGCVGAALRGWRRARRYCPGPRRGWRGWLRLSAAWRTPTCGYDLSGGDRAAPASPVRCPECGTLVAPRARRRSTSSWRPLRLAILLVVLVAVPGWRRHLHLSMIAARLPSGALIFGERLAGPWTPWALRRELIRRCEYGELSARQEEAMLPILLSHLRDDDMMGNAAFAMRELGWRGATVWPALYEALDADDEQERQSAAELLAKTGAPWTPELERVTLDGLRSDDVYDNAYVARDTLRALGARVHAGLAATLDSDDRQARQIAAELLREMDAPPTDDLARVTVEGLIDDDHEPLYMTNANDGLAWCRRNVTLALPWLRAGLDADDDQQRVLCAAILASTRQAPLLHRAIPLLVASLENNEQPCDALIATAALVECGAPSLPALFAALASRDEQMRCLAAHVLRRLAPDAGVPRPPDGTWTTNATLDPSQLALDDLTISSERWP